MEKGDKIYLIHISKTFNNPPSVFETEIISKRDNDVLGFSSLAGKYQLVEHNGERDEAYPFVAVVNSFDEYKKYDSNPDIEAFIITNKELKNNICAYVLTKMQLDISSEIKKLEKRRLELYQQMPSYNNTKWQLEIINELNKLKEEVTANKQA